ncbi:unnamed protein product [Trichogramma brassicae]|uniref:Transmembrane protein 164 n=1 Tax=Trichogramma brassicae TaxID=86971 RepID=A0A6H5I6V3_9HYME|nr:unnamed protein product [Trichogramma brassicae]
MLEWAHLGINASIPRNKGPECANYLTMKRRIVETFFISLYIIALLRWSWKRIKLPKKVPYAYTPRKGKTFLLALMCLVFGIEIGFKLMGKTFVYILNPCHIITILEIYLLAAEPDSPTITAVFRLVVSGFNGPVLAYAFPETDCRPLVQVNLSHMLCPAILDPFDGQNYRLWATTHQFLLIPILYKLFCISAQYLFTKFPLTRVNSEFSIIDVSAVQKSVDNNEVNKDSRKEHKHEE